MAFVYYRKVSSVSILLATERGLTRPRGVAMLHKLPVVLKCNIPSFGLDDVDDETHVLPAFRKLVNLFWIFDQSGAFDILQNTDDSQFPLAEGMVVSDRSRIDLLPSQLREISLDSEPSNDIQQADICVTRQWMQVILWRASMNRGRGFPDAQQPTSLSHPIQIAKEFLETVSRLPSAAMEAHGPAMVSRVRYTLEPPFSNGRYVGVQNLRNCEGSYRLGSK